MYQGIIFLRQIIRMLIKNNTDGSSWQKDAPFHVKMLVKYEIGEGSVSSGVRMRLLSQLLVNFWQQGYPKLVLWVLIPLSFLSRFTWACIHSNRNLCSWRTSSQERVIWKELNTEFGSKQQVNWRGKKTWTGTLRDYARPLAIKVNLSRRNLLSQNDLLSKQRVQWG